MNNGLTYDVITEVDGRQRSIGAGFVNDDGSVAILMDSVPVNGRLKLIRLPERK